MPIGTRNSYSGELSKSRRNISRRNRIRIFPSPNPSPHQNNRHPLIVIIRRPVRSPLAPTPRFIPPVKKPIRLSNHKQIPAAPRKLAKQSSSRQRIFLRKLTKLVYAKHIRHASHSANGREYRLLRLRISTNLVPNPSRKINIAISKSRHRLFSAAKRRERLSNAQSQFPNIRPPSVHAILHRNLRNPRHPMIPSNRHNVIPFAHTLIKIVEQLAKRRIQINKYLLNVGAIRPFRMANNIESRE